jgi:diaminopimelate decarboxylase
MPLVRDASGQLKFGGASLQELVAGLGTPTYVYDLDAIASGARELDEAFDGGPHLIAYAVKANTAGRVIRTLAAQGCGADVVSGPELRVALACGMAPERIVYSGVAKTDDEIDYAIAVGGGGIAAVQVESLEEIARVEARALASRPSGRKVQVSVRVNPSLDLDGLTHVNIATGHDAAKFGVPRADATGALRLVEGSPHLRLVGVAVHVGSQFTSTAPYLEAASMLFDLIRAGRGDGRLRALAFVDTGGGFGVDYTGEQPNPVRPADFVRAVRAEQQRAGAGDLSLTVEPGRSLVAPHGVLLARVIQTKVTETARWLMIDAGMNDLLRPALYQAKHRVVALEAPVDAARAVSWRVVGPVCESSDDFGEHRLNDAPPRAVALLDAGAYGYTMASSYNGRQLPVEAFVSGGRVVAHTVRPDVEGWVAERARA